MKIELIEEMRFNHIWPWYILRVNGEDIMGSWNRDFVEKKYNEVVTEGKFQKSIEIILKSHEIPLSSEEINTK